MSFSIENLELTHNAAPRRWVGEDQDGKEIRIRVRQDLRIKIEGEEVYKHKNFEDDVVKLPSLHEVAYAIPEDLINWHKEELNEISSKEINLRRQGYIPEVELREIIAKIKSNEEVSFSECSKQFEELLELYESYNYEYPYEIDDVVVKWEGTILGLCSLKEKTDGDFEVSMETVINIIEGYIDGDLSRNECVYELKQIDKKMYDFKKKNDILRINY